MDVAAKIASPAQAPSSTIGASRASSAELAVSIGHSTFSSDRHRVGRLRAEGAAYAKPPIMACFSPQQPPAYQKFSTRRWLWRRAKAASGRIDAANQNSDIPVPLGRRHKRDGRKLFGHVLKQILKRVPYFSHVAGKEQLREKVEIWLVACGRKVSLQEVLPRI